MGPEPRSRQSDSQTQKQMVRLQEPAQGRTKMGPTKILLPRNCLTVCLPGLSV